MLTERDINETIFSLAFQLQERLEIQSNTKRLHLYDLLYYNEAQPRGLSKEIQKGSHNKAIANKADDLEFTTTCRFWQ